MNEKLDINFRHAILRLLLHILVYTLIIHIVTAVFCYFMGWSTYFYGLSLIVGGVIVLALGLTSLAGPPRHFGGALPAAIAAPQSLGYFQKHKNNNKISDYRFLILNSATGILTILSGSLIQTL